MSTGTKGNTLDHDDHKLCLTIIVNVFQIWYWQARYWYSLFKVSTVFILSTSAPKGLKKKSIPSIAQLQSKSIYLDLFTVKQHMHHHAFWCTKENILKIIQQIHPCYSSIWIKIWRHIQRFSIKKIRLLC